VVTPGLGIGKKKERPELARRVETIKRKEGRSKDSSVREHKKLVKVALKGERPTTST